MKSVTNLGLMISAIYQGLIALPRLIDEADKTTRILDKNGYPHETHSLETTDGYLLRIHRIPRRDWDAPVAFLMHGILASSGDWVVLGRDKALALMLWDAGYDVWLGNARGNTYSKQHVKLLPQNPRFWDFSWHEIGTIDIPEMIDYVLNATRRRQLHYVGHSQGTTSFFIMTSEKPEYNSKIRSAHALAPIAYMSHAKGVMLRLASGRAQMIEKLFNNLGIHEVLPSNPILIGLAKVLCTTREESFEGLCPNLFYLIGGYSPDQMNASYVPEILEIIPAGCSVRQLMHYAQLIDTGRFCQYDFGQQKNLQRYGREQPPDYDLGRITAPVILYYSDNDLLSHPTDVMHLAGDLGVKPTLFLVPDPMFNHFDYTWGKNASVFLYKPLIDIMKKYDDK